MSPKNTAANTNGKTIKFKLKEKIKSYNEYMTIQNLSEKTNLSRTVIYGILNNTATRIDLSTLTALCVALECEITDILELS